MLHGSDYTGNASLSSWRLHAFNTLDRRGFYRDFLSFFLFVLRAGCRVRHTVHADAGKAEEWVRVPGTSTQEEGGAGGAY